MPRRRERVARAFREGKALPHIDWAKHLGGRPLHPLHAWTDGSRRVYVAFAGHGGKVFAASFSRKDLARMLRVWETQQIRLSPDPTISTRTLLDLITRKLIPSGWLKWLSTSS